jgi:hypothetical protein
MDVGIFVALVALVANVSLVSYETSEYPTAL